MRLLSIGGVLACLVLVACGGQPWCEPESAGPAAGGPGGGGEGGEPVFLQAPQLTVDVTYIKTFSWVWSAVPGASVYRLMEDVDGPAGPQVARMIAELPADRLSFSSEVFLPDRINASYQVLACNGTGCTPSAPTGIVDIDRGIGFFKASQVGAWDEFGAALALSPDGQMLVVGVPSENGSNAGIDSVFVEQTEQEGDPSQGAVYVFRRGSNGWARDAYIKPATEQQYGEFGFAVALAGDAEQGYTLLVGAPDDRSGGQGVNADPAALPVVISSGAVYAFERAASGGWSQHSFIKADAPVEHAGFGHTLSLSQDREWAAVAQLNSPDGGEVLLYQRTAVGWALRQTLQGSNTEYGDNFGAALQLDARGETLVVGAPEEDGASDLAPTSATGDDDSADAAGAVYVFRRSDLTWSASAYLKPALREAGNNFGFSLALSAGGDLLAVGEPGAVVGTGPLRGRAHVFSRVGSNWQHDRDFVSHLNIAEGLFGRRVALASDAEGATLAIADVWESSAGAGLTSAPMADGQIERSGSVFVYRRLGTGAWSAPVAVKAPNNQSQLAFGSALALSAQRGTLAVYGLDNSGLTGIGATPTTDTSAPASGAVYLY